MDWLIKQNDHIFFNCVVQIAWIFVHLPLQLIRLSLFYYYCSFQMFFPDCVLFSRFAPVFSISPLTATNYHIFCIHDLTMSTFPANCPTWANVCNLFTNQLVIRCTSIENLILNSFHLQLLFCSLYSSFSTQGNRKPEKLMHFFVSYMPIFKVLPKN